MISSKKYKPLVVDFSKPHPLADAIKKQMFRERRNYAIIITGKTQTRKSTIAIQLAREIQPSFDMSKQLACVKPENYLEVLTLDNLKRGSVLVLDEFGVGMNHRNWYSFLNKALNYVLQTHGFRGWCVIVTVPYAKYVDSDTKLLFDMLITTVKKNDRKRYVWCKIFELQYNERKGDIYTHSLRRKGDYAKIVRWKIKYPPKHVMNHYFSMSNEDKEELSEDMYREVRKIQKYKDAQAPFDVEGTAKKIKESVDRGENKYIKEWGGRIFVSLSAVRTEFGLGQSRAKEVKNKAEIMIWGKAGGKKI